MQRNGRFISFEGIDGCGKSTQSRLLAEKMRAAGDTVVLTREPGGSAGAEEIRRLLVEGEPGRWSAETEILLFTAARRDHWERLIAPALERGETVICDRFADSTRVYQGTTRGDLATSVDILHDQMIGQQPDLTILIDVDPNEALSRTYTRTGADEKEARFESFGLDFQMKLRTGFLELAKDHPERIQRIDGRGTQAEVATRVAAAVLQPAA